MKEIGEKLKDARENIGISIEEAAEDLKLRPSQIEDIEQGNMEAFQDVFFLKYFIRDYSKYLGLDYEDLVDEFNEYLFDYTSKISLSDIKKAQEQLKETKKEENKISSPYTKAPKEKNNKLIIIGLIFVTILMGVIISILFIKNNKNENNEENIVYTSIVKGVYWLWKKVKWIYQIN